MAKPKVIAFYFPEFHETKENNEWREKGFAGWTEVKTALPWYENHQQPKLPLEQNYYDQTDYRVQEWQSDLAEKYGINGFCYYHYWFNGKKPFEKPMQYMLGNPRVMLPFCICWANEPKLLTDQGYGGEEDWKKHFDYLLPFFKDLRYIQVDKKPVFLIYNYHNIENGNEMLECFQKWAKENGLPGLHIVSTIHSQRLDYVDGLNIDAFVQFEPMYSLTHRLSFCRRVIKFIRRDILGGFIVSVFGWFVPFLRNIKYDFIHRKINEGLHFQSEKLVYNGTFVNWDNTPNMGINSLIVHGGTPGKFAGYFGKTLDMAMQNNSEFVFLNAWNGWTEGAYLEPDCFDGYKYLEAVRSELTKRGLYEVGYCSAKYDYCLKPDWKYRL